MLEGWTGLGLERLREMTLMDLVRETEFADVAALVARAAENEAFSVPGTLIGTLEPPRRVKMDVSRFREDETDTFGLIAIFEDVSLRARLDAELLRAQEGAFRATRLKSEFVATISHELRTPLNGILGLTQLLLEEELQAHQRDSLKLIRNSGNALLRILNDSLDFSKLEAGRLDLEEVPFSLRRLLEEVVSGVASQPDRSPVAIVCTLVDGLPELVTGDPLRVRQIVTNLLANAVKFTSAGTIELGCRTDGEGILLWVSDSGVGIPEDRLAAIFEPFTQVDSSISRRFGGTGLGLSICKQLVSRMGGTITAESKLGVGSTFRVWLPLTAHLGDAPISLSQPKLEVIKAEPPAAHVEVAPLPPGGDGASVLVVEDQAVNATMLSHLLRKDGHTVRIAANGRLAVDAVREQRFDLVLMDIHMPEMDGLEAARQIREFERTQGFRTPIVALTAHTAAGYDERCRAAGMDDFLAKPIDFKRLREIVQRFSKARHIGRLQSKEALERLGNDLELYRAVLAQVLEGFTDTRIALADALSLLDFEAVAKAAHEAKGSLLIAGAMAAAELAEEVVGSAERNDLENLPAQINQLDQAFMEVARSASEELQRGDDVGSH
jgi:signal transduction histidine kinase/DNA-binding response OmpR family regulator